MTEPVFVPREGQVDYTNIRYCPVVNCVLQYDSKILLVQRSKELRLYPAYWNGVSGFLDDAKSVEDKVYEELAEELHLLPESVIAIRCGQVFVQEAEEHHKTWIVFPVCVKVSTDQIGLDWEAETHQWLPITEARKLKLLPGFDQILATLFS